MHYLTELCPLLTQYIFSYNFFFPRIELKSLTNPHHIQKLTTSPHQEVGYQEKGYVPRTHASKSPMTSVLHEMYYLPLMAFTIYPETRNGRHRVPPRCGEIPPHLPRMWFGPRSVSVGTYSHDSYPLLFALYHILFSSSVRFSPIFREILNFRYRNGRH